MINPYEGIDLQSCERILSVSHQHLSHSSQPQAQKVFDRIYASGVRHFPVVEYRPSIISPYNYEDDTLRYRVGSYPPYSSIEYIKSACMATINAHDDCIGGANAEHVFPKILFNGVWNKWSTIHINAIGSEYESYHMDDTGSYGGNNGLEIPYSEAITNMLDKLTYSDAGGVIINHPRYTETHKHINYDLQRFIMDCLDYDPRVLGTDIIEGGSQYALDFDTQLIDNILSTGRRCWIMCQPDWATLDEETRQYKDRGRNELLIPSGLTRAQKDYECMRAYRTGAFFGRYANSPLSVTAISFENNVFSITVANADGIQIITDGIMTEYVGVTTASQAIDPNAKYVRAMAYINKDDDPNWIYFGSDIYKDIVFTNPIMLNEVEYPYEPAYDVQKKKDSTNKRFNMLYWG